MKKLITTIGLLGLLVMFSASDLTAQRKSSSSDGYDKAIKIGPLGFIIGLYNANFEKKLNDKSSFVIGGQFFNFGLSGVDYTSYGLSGQYRMYFKEAISGPYLAPGVSFNMNSATDIENFGAIRVGANIGWQWVTGSRFVIDLGLGVRYRIGLGDNAGDDFNGVTPAFGVQIGYAF